MTQVNYSRPGLLSVQSKARQVFYTGKTVNAIKASRTAIAEVTPTFSAGNPTNGAAVCDANVQLGSVLCRDPYGHDKGIGMDYTRPATAILHEQKVVCVNPNAGGYEYAATVATDGPGRWISVVDESAEVLVRIKDGSITTPTTGANGAMLGVADGTFGLVDLDFPSSTGATLTDSTTGTAGATLAAGVGINTLTIPLTSLATGLGTSAIDLLTNYTPGYRFKLLSLSFVTTVAGTGAGASQVFNLEIGTTNTTGGALTLTLASQATIGTVTSATPITAANVGTASDTLSLELAAGGTVFTAGAGYFVIAIQNMDVADAVATLAATAVGVKALFFRSCAVPLDPALSATDLSGNNTGVRRCRFGLGGVVIPTQ